MAPEKKKNKKVIKLNSQRLRTSTSLKAGDFWITALVLGLVTFGVIMVFSASYYDAISDNFSPYHYLIRGVIWAVLGTMAMLFMASFDYHRLRNMSWLIIGVSFVLLCLLFTPLSMTLNNATRWLDFKIFTIMPGELAKPACIIFVSAFLSRKDGVIRDPLRGVLPMFGLIVVFAGLIMLQPNTSTAITLVIIIIGIMFVAGLNLAYLFGMGGLSIIAFGYLIFSDEDGYRMGRVTSFLDPFADPQGTGYQVIQGLLAMGSGGLFGKGLGKSVQKTLYLPEPQNDFILAIIGEELGFVGLMCLLIAYMALIWRCVRVCINAPDMFGTLLASGVTIMLGVQVVLNMMVVTSMMPPTGIILPFVSWGGNALVIFMACMGILLNVSRHSVK